MPIVSCSETSHWPLKRAQGDRGARGLMVRIWNYGSNQDKAGVEANDRIGFDTVILAIVELK